MRSQSPTTMSGSCHVTDSLETLSASEHDRRAMTSERIHSQRALEWEGPIRDGSVNRAAFEGRLYGLSSRLYGLSSDR
jgi:hypothetical protein